MLLNEPLQDLEECLKELIKTPMGRRAFLISVPVLLTSCASGARHRNREGDNTGQKTTLTVEDEKKMTREILPKMRKDYPAVRNHQLQSYISSLGSKIAYRNSLQGRPYNYNFTVVDVPYVNAFALPAGTVFITAPLLAMADSEAELAGVIGHEIGHIKARHTAERMDFAKREQSKSWLYGLGGGILGGAAGFGLGKLFCSPKDRRCLTKATALGAAAGAGGGLLIQKYAFMANSREDEMEADRIGFITSVKAGYSKDHVGLFYSKLLKMEEDSKDGQNPILVSFADAMSTHPPSRERVVQMQAMSRRVKKSNQRIISTKKFQQMRHLAKNFGRK